MKFTPVRFVSAALVLAVTGGCGQKGPLYLPPKNGTVVTRPATSGTPPQQPDATTQQPQAEPINTPPDKKEDNDTSSRPK